MRDSMKRKPDRVRGLSVAAALLLVLLSGLALTGCEETSHENIDRWMRTEKGPGKLKSAFKDSGLGLELRAHAGQNLIRMDMGDDVVSALEKMSQDKRDELIEVMAKRLWNDARLKDEFAVPAGPQVAAKDALFDLRRFASGDTQRAVDRYLIDWLAEGYYAARARVGRYPGRIIIGTIGPAAAPAILRRAKSMVTAKADAEGAQFKLEDPLLVALAVSGSADGVGLLLDLLDVEHNDKTLQKRARNALFISYVKNDGSFPTADAKALVPHLDHLVELAKDTDRDVATTSDALELIGATGAPACIQPLVGLLTYRHRFDKFIWVAANAAVQCGKADALVPIADALPLRRRYSRKELRGVIVEPMLALADKVALAREARTLLSSKSWVARVIGIELLDSLEMPGRAAEDAELLRGLAKDKTSLRGWWGDQSDLPKRERKKEPRLGQRAAEVAARLDPHGKSG